MPAGSLACDPSLPPLSLYMHFPWCVRKCPYCDFNSHSLRGELPETQYIDALLCDLATEVAAAQGRELQSVFLGGGTPSLFSPRALARLLEGCGKLIKLADDAEITLEANPGTIERGRFGEYRAAGITRVSLGAQSFCDAQLRSLGRIHEAADTRRAAAELHGAGLSNFNLDLMYGLPRQTILEACSDVRSALALTPAHVSHYQLTLEPGTLFGARPPDGLPDQDICADMQDACRELLAQDGLQQYEVSGYARSGARCRHNLNYWQFGDYLGIGAGAHGKLSRFEPGGLIVERTSKWREPRRYLGSQGPALLEPLEPRAEHQVVSRADLPFEYLMNALRLREGFEEQQFELRTGLCFRELAPALERLVQRQLMQHAGDHWCASPRGYDCLNELLADFLPPAPCPA